MNSFNQGCWNIFRFVCIILIALPSPIESSEDGSPIGKFNVYHHSVGGNVFAVNETSILIKSFSYDGLGKDAYFWAGQSGSPSTQGFIVPNENGRTNVLEKYENRDIVLTLPDGKRVDEIRWLAVFDLIKLVSYGDVYIPDDFVPPGIHHLGPLTSRSDDVNSDDVEIVDTKTIRIVGLNLHRDDDQEVFFWAGKGHSPSPRGHILIPDENGYLEPLRPYNHEDVTLTLPGDIRIDQIDWVAVYDKSGGKPLGYASIPGEVNVPPNLNEIEKFPYSLPNCEQLHSELQVSWDVLGQTITIEMIGMIEHDEWMAFGISGSPNRSQMIGSDVAVGYLEKNGKGHVYDLNIDAKSICTTILDIKHGVCKDAQLLKQDSTQLLEAKKINSITAIKFRRQLTKNEDNDKEYITSAPINIIFAIGKLFDNGELAFHRIWNKAEKKIDFGKPINECKNFVVNRKNMEMKPWVPVLINDAKLRTFSAKLGPSAGARGYEGITGLPSPGFSWYIHGFLAPELIMQRGITYNFRVEGGNSPHNVQGYHPLIISTEPNTLSPSATTLAGVELTRRGQSRPIAAGRLCLWMHTKHDRRLDVTFPTFEKYRNSLTLRCENGSAGILEFTPNSSWPDIVYYGSYLAPNLGWKIHIVDSTGTGFYSVSRGGSINQIIRISIGLPLGIVLLLILSKYLIF